MRKPVLIAICSVVAIALVGVGYAAIPDAQGVIHTCVLRNIGTVRVIDTDRGQRCSALETALALNQTGPRGQQGPTGPGGPTGATGPQGPQGPSGAGGALWADVSADGTVWASHGVTTSNAELAAEGQYVVQFTQDVSACAWIVSRTHTRGVGDADPATQLTAFGWGSFGADPNDVFVQADQNGDSVSQAFSLAVFC